MVDGFLLDSGFATNSNYYQEFPNLTDENITTDDEMLLDDFQGNDELFAMVLQLPRSSTIERQECCVCLRETAGDIRLSCGHTNICYRCLKSGIKRSTEDSDLFTNPRCRTIVNRAEPLF